MTISYLLFWWISPQFSLHTGIQHLPHFCTFEALESLPKICKRFVVTFNEFIMLDFQYICKATFICVFIFHYLIHFEMDICFPNNKYKQEWIEAPPQKQLPLILPWMFNQKIHMLTNLWLQKEKFNHKDFQPDILCKAISLKQWIHIHRLEGC